GITYGMGVGGTIGEIAQNIRTIQTKDVHIVQLMGGLPAVSNRNPFSIIQETCRKLSAEGTYLTSYAVVEDSEIRDKIFQNDIATNGIGEQWSKCNEAYFGIGSIDTGTFFAESLRNTQDLDIIRQQGAIGDILGHCFDAEGRFISTIIEDKLVSIPIDMLKKVKKRVAITGGLDKTLAIRGALLSGLVTHIIIDEITAEKVEMNQ
ncbi:hypothetical protein KAJ27_01240, partial [bacterium]|nr:hypothetical protein [bacterium]